MNVENRFDQAFFVTVRQLCNNFQGMLSHERNITALKNRFCKISRTVFTFLISICRTSEPFPNIFIE